MNRFLKHSNPAGFRCLLLLLAAVPSLAQSFSVGVKAGVPITDAYSAVYFEDSNSGTYNDRYLIGPTAEIHFPLNLSFEVDALYRRNGVTAFGNITGKSNITDWQFPFLAKDELKHGTIRPFVDAGLVYRHLSGNALFTYSLPASPTTVVSSNPNLAGFAVGGGITLKILNFRLSPEIRYTHWFDASGDSLTAASVNSNQADLLVGFTF
jgi:hypothetical protein